MTAPKHSALPSDDLKERLDLTARDYCYRFEYADGSAFEIYDDGRAFIVRKDGHREEKRGKIDNRIRSIIGLAVRPRQARIEALEAQLAEARKALEEIVAVIHPSQGGAQGAIRKRAIAALPKDPSTGSGS